MTHTPMRWLTEERDACGVGFIVDPSGHLSHDTISQALRALVCMEHRGGCGSDSDSGDGAGILTAIPWKLLSDWAANESITLPDTESVGVGMLFLPANDDLRAQVKTEIAAYLDTTDYQLV
ncbi:MAG: hypothetical protein AAFX40_05835, partial [Cyanobacteria bacterium J06639_1]